ncbi:MAG: hypothetical protein R3C68_12490 [Myxococcota bacterium]
MHHRHHRLQPAELRQIHDDDSNEAASSATAAPTDNAANTTPSVVFDTDSPPPWPYAFSLARAQCPLHTLPIYRRHDRSLPSPPQQLRPIKPRQAPMRPRRYNKKVPAPTVPPPAPVVVPKNVAIASSDSEPTAPPQEVSNNGPGNELGPGFVAEIPNTHHDDWEENLGGIENLHGHCFAIGISAAAMLLGIHLSRSPSRGQNDK